MNPIKQRIQELVPEVMEPKLRAGCLCFVSDNGERYVTSYDVAIHDGTLEILQFLGSPITLAVVLRAMQSLPETDNKRHYVVNRFGEFLLDAYYSEIKELQTYPGVIVETRWNLAKDNFDDQSPETQAFIGKLLGIEETV